MSFDLRGWSCMLPAIKRSETMNKTAFQGKMRQVRGGLKMRWARLTDDDRRMLDGTIDQVVGLFQERYGDTREQAVKALAHYLESYGLHKHGRGSHPTRTWPLILMSVGMAGFAAMIAFALANRKAAHRGTTPEQFVGDESFTDTATKYG
jgi:uncharacterized protein YjbJ (UPF0337 family)